MEILEQQNRALESKLLSLGSVNDALRFKLENLAAQVSSLCHRSRSAYSLTSRRSRRNAALRFATEKLAAQVVVCPHSRS